MNVVRTIQVPIAASGRGAIIEVEIVEPVEAARWRRRLAIWLVRLAGRLAKMRVRVLRP